MPQFENPPLKRHAALQPLSRDHYTGLVQSQRLIRAAGGDAAARREAVAAFVDAWANEIETHFADEERLLVGLMTDADRRRLLDEHQTLRAIADGARAQRRRVEPDPDWLRHAGQTLADHIRWEERGLFPAIEQRATDEQLRTLQRETDRLEAQRPRNACRTQPDPDATEPPHPTPEDKPHPRRPRLNENVPTWDDTCSCEAEPRWRDLEDEPPPTPTAG